MKMPGDTTSHTRDITLDTYRYLRGGMAVMIVMLGAAVIGERLTATCWQTSISAYYFTTAHSTFIAALCALGVQFIVYKGSSDTEDVLLTFAGILAFIIATVVTTAFLVSRQDDAKSPHRHLYYMLYQGIAAAMIVTLIAVVVLHFALDSWNHWVIVVETALILEFTVYWVIQTIEPWRTPNRFELLPEADQPQLAQRRRTRGPAGLLPEVVEATRPPVRERLLTAL